MLLAANLAYACDYPAPPDSMPNGETASKEEMLAGVKMINEYQEDMNEYLSCIEANEVVAAEATDSDDEAKAQRKEMFNKRYNAAVEEQTLAVEEFNAQIRAYKARPDQ